MLKTNKLAKIVAITILSVFIFTACSQKVIDEINRVLQSGLGGYTKKNPLKIYAIPFKPAETFDSESTIGKLAWDGATRAIIDLAFFSDQIKYVGFDRSTNSAYMNILKTDSFWSDILSNSSQIRSVLKKKCRQKNANAIIYGLYEGDDLHLNLTVYFYSKIDDMIVKERDQVNIPFNRLKSLRDKIRQGKSLSAGDKDLKKMIYEKSRVSSLRAIRKYTEGRAGRE